MFKKFFGNKSNKTNDSSDNIETKTVEKKNKISIPEQRELQIQRKKSIINEFDKSLINFQLETGIWTPLYIVDLYELNFEHTREDYSEFIENTLSQSFTIHKEKLRQKIYRESFNLQPAELLIVIKEIGGEIFLSFKNFSFNREKLIELLNEGFLTSSTHKIFFLTYFIPPIADDLYKFDNITIPQNFEEAVKDIINYCDRNFSTDNVTFEKWESLIRGLNAQGMILKFPDTEKEVKLDAVLTEDYSNIGYHRVKVEEIVKDTIEKNPIVIPLFILFLAFFCSDKENTKIFSYHYLFSPTGLTKQKAIETGNVSFSQLFNKLLDESLLPNQFRKCMATIYYEAFILHQYELEDLLFKFREKAQKSQPKLSQDIDLSHWK